MYLEFLEVFNTRNLKNQQVMLSPIVNIFLGKNGHGKTNLLESIYLISLTKSFKTNKLDNIINFKEDNLRIKGKLYKNNYQYLIEYFYKKNGKKEILINDNSKSKYSDVIGLLNVVLFVPDDLLLLKGSPSLRRRMVDIELSKISIKYFDNLSRYNKLLKERNLYLKNKEIDNIMIDSYNQLLVQYGQIIYEQRSTFVDDLNILINDFYQRITQSNSSVVINYRSNIIKDSDYLTNLNSSLKRDIILQQTSIGIHRDDFIFILNDKDVSAYGSQGEQRSIVLALKLSIVEYIFLKTNDYPLLLLDDVMSELDYQRQDNLIKYLNNKVQTFITTTNLEVLNDDIKGKAKIFLVENGLVKEDVHE